MKPQDRLPGISSPEGAEPEVYLLTREDSRWAFSRRDVMGAAVAAAVTAAKSAQAQTCSNVLSHTSSVQALAFTPDGNTLISASSDRTVKFWRLPLGAHYRTITNADGVYAVAVHPEGSLLAGALGRQVLLWSLPEGQALPSLAGHTNVNRVAISPDGRLLATGAGNAEVTLWAVPERKLLRKFDSRYLAKALVITPDSELLLIANGTGDLLMWSLPEGRLVNTVRGMGGDALAIAPNGQVVAAGVGNNIECLALPGGTGLRTLKGHEKLVSALAITPDGNLLASGSWDTTVRLWSMWDGSHLTTITGHKDSIYGLAISPDGRILASGSADKTIRLWWLPGGDPLNSCLMDLAATPNTGRGIRYTLGGVTYTLPCGAAIPAGAVCTCNCVPGSACSCVSYSSGGGGGGICTCIPVVYRYPN